MKQSGTIVPFVISVVFGAALWFGVSALTGKREAWDASAYWVLAYPAAILACGLLAYVYPERSWRWPIALFEGQAVAMCIRNGEIGSLLPLGVVLLAVIALPAVVVAKLASRRRRRLEEGSL
jgi:peptidoglycan/LPS O-acetylase OafA/YrhL